MSGEARLDLPRPDATSFVLCRHVNVNVNVNVPRAPVDSASAFFSFSRALTYGLMTEREERVRGKRRELAPGRIEFQLEVNWVYAQFRGEIPTRRSQLVH